ncbi:MAG: maleylpyruvate isomerase N-terminal domain-containing protein [Flavipsychrobacter sp.]|nr:maleylpyruvate isomerase N-terminal domain-containing protein [Flavipsychrobacter sp.]
MHIHHVIPIEVKHLFPVLDGKLQELLRSLSEEEWHRPATSPGWQVKDVAAHLLDGNLRSISILRDKYYGDKPEHLSGYGDLVNYLDSLNASWIRAYRRISPVVLVQMLEQYGKEYNDLAEQLDPWHDAAFPVAWAGEEIATNWFHMAREYAAKWLHQQQIRSATGREGLFDPELFHPFVATYMCGLPYTYRDVAAATGTSVAVLVTGLEDEWHINKTDEGWVLRKSTRLQPDSRVVLDRETAWKLFAKAISPEEAAGLALIEGDRELGLPALGLVRVTA